MISSLMMRISFICLSILSLMACSETSPVKEIPLTQKISVCPSSPNCVSSDALDEAHAIKPLQLNTSADQAWQMARELVLELPRTTLVDENAHYLHIEVRSAFWGFVDDLKLELRVDDGEIAIYSASRTGYSDFGVNRKRVEKIRGQLKEKGAIK